MVELTALSSKNGRIIATCFTR